MDSMDSMASTVKKQQLEFLLRVVILIVGMAVVALGLLVLVGWYTHSPTLIQLRPQFVPMQYNTALGFVLSGISLLALTFRLSRVAFVSAATVMLIGIATLFEYSFGVDLGIDQLLMQHYITVLTSHPGRMAPNTAFCLALAGSTVVLSGYCSDRLAQLWGTAGSLVAGLGAVSLIGYATSLETIYGWGELTRMAVHTSVGFVFVGSGFILLSWYAELRAVSIRATWLPFAAGIACLVITLSLWQALHPGQGVRAANLGYTLVLIGGIFLSIALALLVFLTQQARYRATLAEVSRRELVLEISEREKAQNALSASDKRFQLLISGSNEGVWDWDIGTGKEWWSPQFYVLLGYDDGEIVASHEQFLQLLHPEHRDAITRAVREHLEERIVYNLELRMLTKSGKYRWFRTSGQAIWDEDGRPVRMLGMIVDIEDSKQAQLTQAKLEQQLIQSQKIETVGQLTSGIAHDFNNLLGVILGNLELLAIKLPAQAEEQSYLNNAMHTVQRGASLTQRLLTFSRKQLLNTEIVDLSEQVRQMEELLQRTLGEIIEIETVYADDLWSCRADKSQFDNLVLNLALNARDAMPRGGKLSLRLSNAQLQDSYTEEVPELDSGDYVVLAVSDNGEGMSAEVLEHVFEPYFTTKEVGMGSGLGLSMAFGFAKQSQGHLDIYSEIGIGTTVKLYLPRESTEIEAPQEAIEAQIIDGNNETILLVEDEPDLLEVYAMNLEVLGYTVLSAQDGKTALQLYSENPDIKLLLTDVMLPGGMTGPDLVKELQNKDPDLRFIYMSGYTEDITIHNAYLDEAIRFLRKPFTVAELSEQLKTFAIH